MLTSVSGMLIVLFTITSWFCSCVNVEAILSAEIANSGILNSGDRIPKVEFFSTGIEYGFCWFRIT